MEGEFELTEARSVNYSWLGGRQGGFPRICRWGTAYRGKPMEAFEGRPARGRLWESLGIPRESLGIPRESVRIPKESTRIPMESVGIPRASLGRASSRKGVGIPRARSVGIPITNQTTVRHQETNIPYVTKLPTYHKKPNYRKKPNCHRKPSYHKNMLPPQTKPP